MASDKTSFQSEETETTTRFHLAVQKTRLVTYTLSFVAFAISHFLKVFTAPLLAGFLLWVAATASICFFYVLYSYQVDRRFRINLTPWWLFSDIILTTIATHFTGGNNSPWFVWYIAIPATAAFTMGRMAANIAVAGTYVAYVSMVWLRGELVSFDVFALATVKLFFLFGASFFMVNGIVNLRQKRRQIQQLKIEESKKVEELTRLNEQLVRLAAELDVKTRELAVSNTQLSHANVQIQEHDRLKSEFLANMSHELRTPLNAIIGFAEILSDRLRDDISARHVGFLEAILSSGQHLLSIINDILDLSKIEAGRMEFYPEKFNVRDAIEAVCVVAGGVATKKNVTLHIDISADVPQLESDVAKFKQVLYNLVSNATKFSASGDSVLIKAERTTMNGCDAVAVSVEDHGVGIAPEHYSLIFQEFRQVDSRLSRNYEGTGLGLALVKKFVEKQGGTITVRSEVGKGSEFTVTFPLSWPDEVSSAIAPMSSPRMFIESRE